MKFIVRIDERLIHGQVAYSWTVEYNIGQIVVIDNEVAKNEIQKMALSLAVPPQKKLAILEIEQAIKFLKDNEKTNQNVLVVVKSPGAILELVNNDIDIKSVNVGGMYFKPGKKQISKTVYIDDEDRHVFSQLHERGIEAEIRTAPKDKKQNLYELI